MNYSIIKITDCTKKKTISRNLVPSHLLNIKINDIHASAAVGIG